MAVRKAGLGKGLDSLIPEHSVRRKAEKTEQKPEKNELLLKITDIEPNREQPRSIAPNGVFYNVNTSR